tara:strand:- start:5910 stop:6317 length:408 start_codon:yes stop_codon:yes gene_type:complete
MSNPLNIIRELFVPAADLIDSLHTSDEEKLEAKRKMLDTQTEISLTLLGYEARLMESKHDVIMSEANGQSILQRNWRPITMLTFLILVVLDSFGVLPTPLATEAWTLLQIGLGGYVVGRSAEKIVPNIMATIRKN